MEQGQVARSKQHREKGTSDKVEIIIKHEPSMECKVKNVPVNRIHTYTHIHTHTHTYFIRSVTEKKETIYKNVLKDIVCGKIVKIMKLVKLIY